MAKIKIQKGDTLSRIAQANKTTVPNLLRANPNITNPDLIFAGADINLPGAPKPEPTGRPTPETIRPTGAKPTGVGVADVIRERAGAGPTDKDKLIERLTAGIEGISAFKPSERRQELQAERGITQKREQIGTFEEEIQKTTTLLDDLAGNIKERTGGFLVSDPQRARIEAVERDPLVKQLGKLTGGLGILEKKLGREEADITAQLGLEEAELTRPLELLSTQLGLETDIQDLFEDEETQANEAAILGVIAQGFDDPLEISEIFDGDLSIDLINETINKAFSTEREKEGLELDLLKRKIAEIDDPIDRQIKLATLAQIQLENDKIRIETTGSLASDFEVGGAQFTKKGDLTADGEKKVQILESGLKLVDQVEDLYINMIGDESFTFNNPFLGGIQQRLKGRGVPLVGAIPFIDTPTTRANAQIYQDFLDSNRAPVAKGLKGEVGNLTENEQKQALKSFPGIFDTPEVAREKFENIRRQITDNLSTLGSFDTEPDFGRVGDDIDLIIDEETQ